MTPPLDIARQPIVAPTYLSRKARAGLLAEVERRRKEAADRRAVVIERRAGDDRRSGCDRRFATMSDKLAAVEVVRSEARFTGAGPTDYGLLGI